MLLSVIHMPAAAIYTDALASSNLEEKESKTLLASIFITRDKYSNK